MSKVKHTPGPWTCHSGAVYVDGPNVYPKGEEDGIPIAKMDREVGNGTIPVERDCNAHLIAAAPEMFAALELLCDDLDKLDLLPTLREYGREAMAKAKGGI